jgi:hypothetical protein
MGRRRSRYVVPRPRAGSVLLAGGRSGARRRRGRARRPIGGGSRPHRGLWLLGVLVAVMAVLVPVVWCSVASGDGCGSGSSPEIRMERSWCLAEVEVNACSEQDQRQKRGRHDCRNDLGDGGQMRVVVALGGDKYSEHDICDRGCALAHRRRTWRRSSHRSRVTYRARRPASGQTGRHGAARPRGDYCRRAPPSASCDDWSGTLGLFSLPTGWCSDADAAEDLASVLPGQPGLLERLRACGRAAVTEQPGLVVRGVHVNRPIPAMVAADHAPPVLQVGREVLAGDGR